MFLICSRPPSLIQMCDFNSKFWVSRTISFTKLNQFFFNTMTNSRENIPWSTQDYSTTLQQPYHCPLFWVYVLPITQMVFLMTSSVSMRIGDDIAIRPENFEKSEFKYWKIRFTYSTSYAFETTIFLEKLISLQFHEVVTVTVIKQKERVLVCLFHSLNENF